MKRILFVTNRNIVNTCGELRLVKNRAEVLYNAYKVRTDFLVFSHKKIRKPEKIEAGGETEIFHYALCNPIQQVLIKKKLVKRIISALQTGEYDTVVLSGGLVIGLVDLIKKTNPGLTVIADIHGAFEELIEFPSNKKLMNLARRTMYYKTKRTERKYLPRMDYLFAVSEALKRYLNREYKINTDKVFVVPCSMANELPAKEKLDEYRINARTKYGIKSDETLFIYSGGVSKWQCIDETVEIFKEIKGKIKSQKCKLLLLSNNLEYIRKYADDCIIVDSVSPVEVPLVLPAGDYAFLIRGNYVTNRVAFPNKFLEYVSAGLKVITTAYLEDVAQIVHQNEIGFVLSDTSYEEGLLEYIGNSHRFGDDLNQRQLILDGICFENRLKNVVKL